ncbi:MAG: molecular chaperone TorD family protein [Acidobacteria bacterium]|nr:molecular chaperone TorD family protein [Acidobacteriota bacterium]
MTNQTRLYDLLARLLSYPQPDYSAIVRECQELLQISLPDNPQILQSFSSQVQSSRLEELEELFTRTFDLNPLCSLEVGWQLYGEDYNRGSFMVKMRGLLRAHGVTESIELPDHLANVLPLVGRMEPEEAGPLCASYILPALEKMQAGLAGKDNPYEEVLLAVRHLIEPLAAPFPQPARPLIQIERKEEVSHD